MVEYGFSLCILYKNCLLSPTYAAKSLEYLRGYIVLAMVSEPFATLGLGLVIQFRPIRILATSYNRFRRRKSRGKQITSVTAPANRCQLVALLSTHFSAFFVAIVVVLSLALTTSNAFKADHCRRAWSRSPACQEYRRTEPRKRVVCIFILGMNFRDERGNRDVASVYARQAKFHSSSLLKGASY
jgi:hypothetical protein